MAEPKKPLPWMAMLPLIFFAGLALIFYVQLKRGDDGQLPSALLGKSVPETIATPLEGTDIPGFAKADFIGKVSLVNVWASWCGPCRAEHPLLVELSKEPDLQLLGINYKDAPDQARGFLQELGNPYQAINADRKGRAAIEWGVFGVPETYIVGKDGVIAYRYAGPITKALFDDQIRPVIDEAQAR